MPAGGYRQARCPVNPSADQLAVLKALGDETRYAMYRELARSTRPLSAQDLAERLGAPRQHRPPPPRAAPRGRPRRRRGGPPRHRRPAPAPLLPRRRRARRSASTRPRTRCSPGCWPRSPSASAPTPTTPPTPGGRGVPRPDGAPGPTAASPRSSRSSPGSGSSPRSRPPTAPHEGSARIEFLHCPFRELAEAYPELVCNLHRGLCEGVVDAAGGGRVEEFATLYDPEPCHVVVGVGASYSEDDR